MRALLGRAGWAGAAAGLFVLILTAYGLFEARLLIEGPAIAIDSPRDGSAVAGPLLRISGSARNVAFLAINGAQAYTDQNHRFDEAIAPPPGYTVLTVSGKDRFNQVSTKTVRITMLNYCPANV